MSGKAAVLSVGTNARNLELLVQFLTRAGYPTVSVKSMDELERALSRGDPIGLAIIDVTGFDQSIWRHCDRLRELHIPIVVLSTRENEAMQVESYAHGAWSVHVKPVGPRQLLGVIRGLMSAYQ